MKDKAYIREAIQESITTKSELFYDQGFLKKVEKAAQLLIKTVKKGGKIIACGNGGSAADSQHLVAEMVGRFQKERRGLPAIALSTNTSILTALGNDYSFDNIFERQVEALATKKDLLFAISTSGHSANVLRAVKIGRKIGLKSIGLTGGDGGKLKELVDIPLIIPTKNTPRVQEAHIMIIHILCGCIENAIEK